MTAYNVGMSFLNAIINGDNDHLCFFFLTKNELWVYLTKSI